MDRGGADKVWVSEAVESGEKSDRAVCREDYRLLAITRVRDNNGVETRGTIEMDVVWKAVNPTESGGSVARQMLYHWLRQMKVHGCLSGPGSGKIMEREYEVYGRSGFENISQISVAHLYNVGRGIGYRGSFTCQGNRILLRQPALEWLFEA